MDFYDFTLDLIKEAGKELTARKKENFSVHIKNDNLKDIVTSLDIELGSFITRRIQESFPDHGIYNEEADKIEGIEYEWVLDPIDGTASFARGIPQYAISIGLLHQGGPIVGAVLDVSNNELFSFAKGKGAFLNGEPISVSSIDELKASFVLFAAGRKDEQIEWAGESYKRLLGSVNKIKNFGSSALSVCYIAAGRIESIVYGTLSTMDIGAALGILYEAGGIATDARGENIKLQTTAQRVYLANTKKINQGLIDLLESD